MSGAPLLQLTRCDLTMYQVQQQHRINFVHGLSGLVWIVEVAIVVKWNPFTTDLTENGCLFTCPQSPWQLAGARTLSWVWQRGLRQLHPSLDFASGAPTGFFPSRFPKLWVGYVGLYHLESIANGEDKMKTNYKHIISPSAQPSIKPAFSSGVKHRSRKSRQERILRVPGSATKSRLWRGSKAKPLGLLMPPLINGFTKFFTAR